MLGGEGVVWWRQEEREGAVVKGAGWREDRPGQVMTHIGRPPATADHTVDALCAGGGVGGLKIS